MTEFIAILNRPTSYYVSKSYVTMYTVLCTWPILLPYQCTALQVKRDPLETECTDDRSSVALCNLVNHGNELPPHLQNFDRKLNIYFMEFIFIYLHLMGPAVFCGNCNKSCLCTTTFFYRNRGRGALKANNVYKILTFD